MTEDNKNQPQKPADQSSNNENANVEYLKPVERPMPPPKQEPIPKGYGRDVIERELCIWFGGGMQPRLMSDDEAKLLDTFPYFGYRRNPDEKLQYLKVDMARGLCEFVSKAHVVNALGDLWANFLDTVKATRVYCLGVKRTEAIAESLMEKRLFMGETKPTGYLKTPNDFTFCFHRYDFEPIRNHPAPREAAPIFFSFIDRMENARALCQVIGASLAGEPIRKMAPLIFGKPGCGKSMFLSILREIFGPGWQTFTGNWTDRYALMSLENKTAWGIDEVDSKFIGSELFKRITGSDTIEIRKPYKGAIDTKLYGNFYMNCNRDVLEVFNNQAIIKERLIPCSINGVIPDDDRISVSQMLARIAPEMPYIHGYCLDLYFTLGNHVSANLDPILDVVSETESDLDVLFDQYFILDPEAVGHKAEVSLLDFRNVLNQIYMAHPSIGRKRTFDKKFRRYVASKLKRDHYSMSVKKFGVCVKMVAGVRLK